LGMVWSETRDANQTVTSHTPPLIRTRSALHRSRFHTQQQHKHRAKNMQEKDLNAGAFHRTRAMLDSCTI
jgi:hypothetical protein